MSRVLRCSSSNQKTPLTLMEMPENGPLHSYGAPVSKSTNPCTVKQVHSIKENARWFSPDRVFLNKSEISQKKSGNNPKSNLARSENVSPSVQTRTKPRRRRYPKLEMVQNDSTSTKDDNKENIRPETDHQQALPVTSDAKSTDCSRTFAGRSLRTNLI